MSEQLNWKRPPHQEHDYTTNFQVSTPYTDPEYPKSMHCSIVIMRNDRTEGMHQKKSPKRRYPFESAIGSCSTTAVLFIVTILSLAHLAVNLQVSNDLRAYRTSNVC